jgi:hypothetical protein
MPRFEDDLLRHIHDQVTDHEGVQHIWIKATKHSSMFLADHGELTTNVRGGNWNIEVNGHFRSGDISIYTIPPSRETYFVLPNDDCRNQFVETHDRCKLKTL